MYDTGARPKAPETQTPYLTDDVRRLFHSSEDRRTSRPKTEVQKVLEEAPHDARMPPKPVRPREVPFKAPIPARPPSQRSSTPLEPMATMREQMGLYTSVEECEDQTLEGFKSMSIFSNDARDSSSLNIRTGGLQRPNSRMYTDTPKRTNSKLTIPEKIEEEPKPAGASVAQIIKAYEVGKRVSSSRSGSRSSSRASSVSSKRSTKSCKSRQNDTVGGNTVDPGNASTGGRLPTFTQAPPSVPASIPVPVSMPVSVSVPMSVPSSFVPVMPNVSCPVPNVCSATRYGYCACAVSNWIRAVTSVHYCSPKYCPQIQFLLCNSARTSSGQCSILLRPAQPANSAHSG